MEKSIQLSQCTLAILTVRGSEIRASLTPTSDVSAAAEEYGEVRINFRMATIDSTLTAERVNKAGYVRDKVIAELEARGYKDGKDFHTKGTKRTSAPKLKLMLIDDIKTRSLQQAG